jgi:hypothetical protein
VNPNEPVVLESYYRARWGLAGEFIRLVYDVDLEAT